MVGALINCPLSGRSSFGISTGLEMSECVVELILIAEDIART
jgi:hypothetical protein